MNIPADYIYAKTDEWAKVDNDVATIGITDYAQEQLSDVVYVEFIVSVGDNIEKGQQIATVELVKAAADINSPVSGKVIAVNEDLPSSPEQVNQDPFVQAWMIRVEMSNPAEARSLMNSDAYSRYVEERSE